MPEQPLVLVVEDEESFVDALRVGLKREGFLVEVAHDGVDLGKGESHREVFSSRSETLLGGSGVRRARR